LLVLGSMPNDIDNTEHQNRRATIPGTEMRLRKNINLAKIEAPHFVEPRWGDCNSFGISKI